MTNYPHKCPECQAPAYVGFTRVECSAPEVRCRHSDGSAQPRGIPLYLTTCPQCGRPGLATVPGGLCGKCSLPRATAPTKPAIAAYLACPDCGSTNLYHRFAGGNHRFAGGNTCMDCGSRFS